ncbi:hypothetical protein TNCV_2879901 [Trichonephila clavipes]|uniref:Uncharacterized protein n=1 Tax=Trichonephila clavipes TaxID=2585209 RepID=A0A8X6W1P8_TRICX|nr:hypothetical protein TNCV_2879901 [Trichonephila clavipes]
MVIRWECDEDESWVIWSRSAQTRCPLVRLLLENWIRMINGGINTVFVYSVQKSLRSLDRITRTTSDLCERNERAAKSVIPHNDYQSSIL